MLSTYFENRLNYPVTERDGEVESELSSKETRKHHLRLRKYTEKKRHHKAWKRKKYFNEYLFYYLNSSIIQMRLKNDHCV